MIGGRIKRFFVFVWSVIKDLFRDSFSLDSWRDVLRFVWRGAKSIKKDATYAYDIWHRKHVDKESMPSSPVKKAPALLPGDGLYEARIVRFGVSVIIMGALFGAYIAEFVAPWWIFLLFLFLLPILGYQMANYRLGHIGERIVGEELEKLARERGWRVFHSFCIDEKKGDIDHIVVSPKCVFCLEVKTRRHSSDSAHGRQISLDGGAIKIKGRKNDFAVVNRTKGNARNLFNFIKEKLRTENGKTPFIPLVAPVVVFPGWYVVEQKGKAAAYICNHERIVKVLDGAMENSEPMPENLIKDICAALEKHNRINIEDML